MSLKMYDGLPPEEAVAAAWLIMGRNPNYHVQKKAEVRNAMPLLARALDRMAEEYV